MKKKIIFILIESAKRELNSKTLLALRALNKNYRVVIGHKGTMWSIFNMCNPGIVLLKSIGVHVAIISGRGAEAVHHRGNELGMLKIIQNSRNKLKDFEANFLKNYNFKNFQDKWVELMLDLHERHGSWDNGKLYNRWEIIDL